MPEQKMTYQERVQKEIDDVVNHKGFPSLDEQASISIGKQAEAIREILNIFFDPAIIDFDRVLLEHGYIEPKNNQDDRN